ncbi:uncharacterized protein BO72DRAFT_478467 [Aspergillus fijiensis CBS 313.89]|uniref:Aminoglycoside phosphotransferase domain-containing protein n=1 Tax=Aspergillus fijiensis CBS 313.89 TaxID=1448319 RepID=A0A8G1RSG8_9EURO|nr:uncharacterized protein BO72DRAFT_478467 [Aspergillus fijiensis CBS 313.89]RAK75906.1 hypothetical protein BO72DRAFT_478467 [Aspergillus fijiensis CBS 313.89]
MSTRAAVLPLLRGSITLDEALDQEEDMLLELSFPKSRMEFFVSLYSRRQDIAMLVADHLQSSRWEQCFVEEVKEWIHGSFNVCIPVRIESRTKQSPKRVMIRFPLPYKVGEALNPGNLDIPIPRLWGFGFPGGQTFSIPKHMSFMAKIFWYAKRCVSWLLDRPLPCPYISHRRQHILDHGYLVMDYIDEPGVQMLSETWNKLSHAGDRTTNLYRDLSRIMLSLSQLPLLRIGSWTIDTNGVLQLTNRPLTLRLHQLENAGIPTNVDRNLTYTSADSYYHDILSCHDSRLRHQPNSMHDEDDGRAQMANLTMMRALLPHFTDLHQSNIFVDKDWHIRYLIDLEWTCSLPVETLRPPYWLTGRPVDDILGEHLNTFNEAHGKFVDIFQEEEKRYPPLFNVSAYRTNTMRRGWGVGNFWYFHALDSPKGLFNIFRDHIQPRFSASQSDDPTGFSRIVSQYWSVDTKALIGEKSPVNQDLYLEHQTRGKQTTPTCQPPPHPPPSCLFPSRATTRPVYRVMIRSASSAFEPPSSPLTSPSESDTSSAYTRGSGTGPARGSSARIGRASRS